MEPSLQFWFILGPNLLSENQKYCLKPKISGKPTSLGISNSISPRSQKNPNNSCKINQKQTFWAQIGYKLQCEATSKGYQKFSHRL